MTMSANQPAIALQGISKRFGRMEAVRGVSFEIGEGEFFSVLGPSGCGKTTTLRMIAGFEEPDEGTITLRGVDVVGIPANRREVNMVFQHYALFPHMDVYRNVVFGLKLKKISRKEQRDRAKQILDVVGLEGMERRRPSQLSGGQQQRVALARALVNRPAALLLDEPLGALDVKLRKQMQLELKRIQLELGTTFVYVTHDQEEALSMSDRIAVMNGGQVDQIGTPREVYEHPATAFVADFIGVLNALEFRVDRVDGDMAIMQVSDHERMVVMGAAGSPGDRLTVAVRPERIRIHAPGASAPEDGSKVEGVIARVVYLGSFTQYHVDTSTGARVTCHRLNDEAESVAPLDAGSRVVLTWGPEQGSVLGGIGPADRGTVESRA